MKIAIVTANLGGIDEVLPIPRQSIECDFFHYNESNLPWPLTNLDNRLKAKYIKLRTHRVLPGYDAYIWIDGRVEIVSPYFAEEKIKELHGYQMAIFKHRLRNNPFEELQYILDQIRKGNGYFINRYAQQPMLEEYVFCEQEKMPADFPLFWCGLFSRRNNAVMNSFFDEWWNKCIEFSTFDQALFSYLVWKERIGLNILQLPCESFKINRHKTG